MHHPTPRDKPGPEHRPIPSAPDPGPVECGQKGHLHAVWTHKLAKAERRALKAAKYPKLCIHGRRDIIAQARLVMHASLCNTVCIRLAAGMLRLEMWT
jgi:hypothetical protein